VVDDLRELTGDPRGYLFELGNGTRADCQDEVSEARLAAPQTAATSVTFASASAAASGVAAKLGLDKSLAPVSGTRNVRMSDMRLNDYCPTVEVDPETYEVRADGELLTCEPAHELPLAQRYFLF
jgi:urease alpha subunit